MRVAVLGGSGKTGRAVRAALHRRGAASRSVGRAEWPRLRDHLAGCEAAYVVAPNLHPDEPAYVAAALEAAGEAGVGRVVYHSVTAPYAPDLPHHVGKAVAEDLVRRSGLGWTVLQPCAYLQNLLPPLRAAPPRLAVPYDVDVLFGLVDLPDVGEAAAVVLTEDGHHGATYELAGPALVSVRDVAAAAGRVLGRPVPVERVAAADAEGGDARTRDWLLRMFAYYDRHGLPAGPVPLRALLGREPAGLLQALTRELAVR